MSIPPPRLKDVISSASYLLGISVVPTTKQSISAVKDSLSSILLRRIISFQRQIKQWSAQPNLPILSSSSVYEEIELKRMTAEAAIFCLLIISENIQNSSSNSFNNQPHASTSTSLIPPPPLFGSRDLKVLSMLSGVIGRWGLASTVVEGVLPQSLRDGAPRSTETSKFTEIVEDDKLEDMDETLASLNRLSKDVWSIVLVSRNDGSVRGSDKEQLAGIVLPQLLIPLMGALLQLGYEKEEGETWAKDGLGKLCSSVLPTTVFASLLALLCSASNKLLWLRPALSSLLSSQLLRNGGVRALLLVVVGGDDEVGLPKLEMLSKLMATKSLEMSYEAYFSRVVPQLFNILASGTSPKSTTPVSILRSAAFILSHLIDLHPSHDSALSNIFLPLIHSNFLPATYLPHPLSQSEDSDSDFLPSVVVTSQKLTSGFNLLSLILLHAPPSPNLLPYLLSPIISSLFSLSQFLLKPSVGISFESDSSDEGNVDIVEELNAILELWGKTLSIEEVVKGVRKVIEDLETNIEFGNSSEVNYQWSESNGKICIRLSEISREVEGVELIVDPIGIVDWLKKVGRKEVEGKLFLRWLDEVQTLKGEAESLVIAKRSVVRLQLVLKMVEEFGADILQEPTQIVAFVAHALDATDIASSSPVEPVRSKAPTSGIGLDDLKIIADDDNHKEEIRDQEDENAGLGLGPDEMILTALTLLLAVLEANEDLNMTTTPLLSLIHSKLGFIASESTSELVPSLAKEARLVLSVRQASAYATTSSASDNTAFDPLAASRVKYQEALKLLQDPLLPVRAQGLSVLRSLIVDKSALLSTDPALLPAVLDIFIQAIEDDDSFLYLNAIQGLSSLADVYGKQIIRKLLEVYRGGRELTNVPKEEKGGRELDKRLRMGETLERVVQRAGEAMALFVDDLIPTLLAILRSSTLPTTLRSSTLTILAAAIQAAPIALLAQADSLADACLTLLSIESRPLQPIRRNEVNFVSTPSTKSKSMSTSDSESDDEEEEEEETESSLPTLDRNGKPRRPEETLDPLLADSKHPVLRRSAILFLSILFRTAQELMEADEVEDGGSGYDELNPLGSMRIGGNSRGGGGSRRSRTALVGIGIKKRARNVLGYVASTDEDSLVRHQAGEVLDKLGRF